MNNFTYENKKKTSKTRKKQQRVKLKKFIISLFFKLKNFKNFLSVCLFSIFSLTSSPS